MSEKIETNFVYRFSGLILEVRSDSFLVRLIDLTRPTNPDLECDYKLSEVSAEHLERVFVGNSFSLVITQAYKDGRLISARNIYLRPLEYWTQEEIEEAKKAGEELFKSFKFE